MKKHRDANELAARIAAAANRPAGMPSQTVSANVSPELAGSKPHKRSPQPRKEPHELRAGFRQHYVCRLQVAMHHAALVRSLQPLANLNPIFQHQFGWKRALRQAFGQRLAFQELHDQEVDAILMADVVQGANVGMVQGRYSAGLAIETLLGVWIIRKMTRQDFYCDRAIKASVLRSIYLAHTAGAERRDDFVGAELCARVRAMRAQL
jgi:hypothetical protein